MATNEEGQMPAWEIPAEWNSAAAISEAGVTFHGQFPSPPCCKIMYILKHYNVTYAHVTSKKKDTEYKKIPVLVIGDKQINDSEIIATVLASILDTPYSEREKGIEKVLTSGLMISFEADVMESTADLQKCACAIGGCIGCMMWTFSCLIPCSKASAALHKKFPDLQTPAELGTVFADFLTTKPYFHGDSLGTIDCSVYGVLSPFHKSGNKCFSDFMAADERLAQWWARMEGPITTEHTPLTEMVKSAI